MFKRGMKLEEVKAMVKENGWEILEEETYEEKGKSWTDMTVWQDDHGVDVYMNDEEGIFEIMFVPAWEL